MGAGSSANDIWGEEDEDTPSGQLPAEEVEGAESSLKRLKSTAANMFPEYTKQSAGLELGGSDYLFPAEFQPAASQMVATWMRTEHLNAAQAMFLSLRVREVRKVLRSDNSLWRDWFRADFPDVVRAVGDELPSWIRDQNDRGDERFAGVPWRRYYIWTMFFARRAYKVAVDVLHTQGQKILAHTKDTVAAGEHYEDPVVPVCGWEKIYVYGPLDMRWTMDFRLRSYVMSDLSSPLHYRNPCMFHCPGPEAGETLTGQYVNGVIGKRSITVLFGSWGDISGRTSEQNDIIGSYYPVGADRSVTRPDFDQGAIHVRSNIQSLLVNLSPKRGDVVVYDDDREILKELLFARFKVAVLHSHKRDTEIGPVPTREEEELEGASASRHWRFNLGDEDAYVDAFFAYCAWFVSRLVPAMANSMDTTMQGLASHEHRFQAHEEYDHERKVLAWYAMDRLPTNGHSTELILRALPPVPMVRRHGSQYDQMFIGAKGGGGEQSQQLFRCSRCKGGVYRSKQEQLDDWPVHQLGCNQSEEPHPNQQHVPVVAQGQPDTDGNTVPLLTFPEPPERFPQGPAPECTADREAREKARKKKGHRPIDRGK
jgi:hypothetical protein